MAAKIPTEAEVLGYFQSLSNWGRWGDDDQREFSRERVRAPEAPGVEPMYITFETDQGETYGAVTYFSVVRHQKGFPELRKFPGEAPYGWIRQVSRPG